MKNTGSRNEPVAQIIENVFHYLNDELQARLSSPELSVTCLCPYSYIHPGAFS